MHISEVINNINVALNYPSATIDDLRLYMNQAISEINSELHLALPSINEMEKEVEEELVDTNNLVLLTNKPDSSTLIPVYTGSEEIDSDYYYDTTQYMFAIKKDKETVYVNNLYGIYNDYSSPPIIYQAVVVSDEIVMWYVPNTKNVRDFDLENYLPKDWIYLYFIPYVCFKYTVRDGDTGALFSDEFTQGFQQLRNAYSIPNYVILKSVAHKYAYKKQVLENINKLYIKVPTRAIYDDMKVPDTIKAYWGDDFYSSGGWGL